MIKVLTYKMYMPQSVVLGQVGGGNFIRSDKARLIINNIQIGVCTRTSYNALRCEKRCAIRYEDFV